MSKYQVSLGKNRASLKKVFISLPNGIYDLKLQAPEGMLLDRSSYMYAFARGLKDLINSSVIKVTIKDEQKNSSAGIKFGFKGNTEQVPPTTEKPLIVEEKQEEVAVAPESESEPETEAEPAVGTEAAVEETPAEEQPKKKSKKKK